MKPLLFALRPYGPGIFGLLLLLLTASQGHAQIRVTGTAIDEGGGTLPGISVVISGAGKGSIVNNATSQGHAQIRVTGTAIDEGGGTLPGISVVISGAGKGSIVNNATNRVTNTRGGYEGSPVVVTIGQSRLVDINPQDIDRIEVLNRAAAPAI
jgi:hypothetical protein